MCKGVKKENNIVVLPQPQMSMNNSNIIISNNTNNNNTNNININNTNNNVNRVRNCYITPLHGLVNNKCFCYPFFSYDLIEKKINLCSGDGEIYYKDKAIRYAWRNIFTINFETVHSMFTCLPYCCFGCTDITCTYVTTCIISPICCLDNDRCCFLGIPIFTCKCCC
jgi:hypothetical protein